MNIFGIVGITALVSLTAVSCAGPLGSGASEAGVARTINGGVDWTLSNIVVTGQDKKGRVQTSTALTNTDIAVLRFEPNNSKRIYAATLTDGVYVTEDAADTWKQILSKVAVYDFVIDPKNVNHLYAAGSAGGNGKVLESKDKGKSWEEIYNEVSRQNPVQAMAMSPTNSNDIVIGLASGNLIKSTDGGVSWSLVQNFGDPIKQITWTGSGLYVLTGTRGLYMSTGGNNDFDSISEGLLNFNKNAAITTPGPGDTVLPNVDVPQTSIREFNQFAVSPRNSKLLYVAADNGLYKTLDGGETWGFVKLPLKHSSSPVEVSSVSIGTVDSLVYAGAGNTAYKSLNSGESWQVQSIATSSFIQYILIDPRLSQVAFIGLNGDHR